MFERSIREKRSDASKFANLSRSIAGKQNRPSPNLNRAQDTAGFSGENTFRKMANGDVHHGMKYGDEWYYRKYTKSGEDEWDITNLIGVERIQSKIFSQNLYSGVGWGVTPDDKGKYTLEIDNAIIRGKMIIWEMIINQLRASNGTFIVGSSAKVGDGDNSVVDLGGGNFRISFNQSESTYVTQPFAVGDVICSKRFWLKNQQENWGVGASTEQIVATVTSIGVEGYGEETITITIDADNSWGLNATPVAGQDFVRVASNVASRQGLVVMSSDGHEDSADSDAINVPFIDVYNGLATFENFLSALGGDSDFIQVRMGRLDQLTGNTDEFGLWAKVVHLVGTGVEGVSNAHYGTRAEFDALTSTETDTYHDGDLWIFTNEEEQGNVYQWRPDGVETTATPSSPLPGHRPYQYLTPGITYTIVSFDATDDDFTYNAGSADNNNGTTFKALVHYPLGSGTYGGLAPDWSWERSTLKQYWVDITNEELVQSFIHIANFGSNSDGLWSGDVNQLTPYEWNYASSVLEVATAEHQGLLDEATTWNVNSGDYTTAYTDLVTYMGTIDFWNNYDYKQRICPVNGTDWSTYWNAYFNEYADLKEAIQAQAYAYNPTDGDGFLKNFPPTPSGDPGLYLSANYMGYHDGSGNISGWETFMDKYGNFYLGGTAGSLRWNAQATPLPTLYIEGEIHISNPEDINTNDLTNDAGWTDNTIADGEIVGFYQTGQPDIGTDPGEAKFGDIWIDTDFSDPLTSTCIFRCEDSNGQSIGTLGWYATPDNAIGLLYLNNYIIEQATKDVTTYYQTGQPGGASFKDIWIDTDKADPVDYTCIHRYENADGSSNPTLGWQVRQDDAVGIAIVDAYNAQIDATQAISDAYDNGLVINRMNNDDMVSVTEKVTLVPIWNGVVAEGAVGGTIRVQASTFGLTGHATYTAFTTAYDNLVAYLGTLVATTGDSVDFFSTGTTIDTSSWTEVTGGRGSNWDVKWVAYWNARTEVLNLFAETAKDLADEAQDTADDKNTIFYATGSPSPPTPEKVGDIWYDTDDYITYRCTALPSTWTAISTWTDQLGRIRALPSPAENGLHLGGDYMGYWNSTHLWMNVITSWGDVYFKGANGTALFWDYDGGGGTSGRLFIGGETLGDAYIVTDSGDAEVDFYDTNGEKVFTLDSNLDFDGGGTSTMGGVNLNDKGMIFMRTTDSTAVSNIHLEKYSQSLSTVQGLSTLYLTYKSTYVPANPSNAWVVSKIVGQRNSSNDLYSLYVIADNDGAGDSYGGWFDVDSVGHATGNYIWSYTTGATKTAYGTYSFGVGGSTAYGVRGGAYGASSVNAGGYFSAGGSGTTGYGIYATCADNTTDWAGYFASGNVAIENILYVGRNTSDGRINFGSDTVTQEYLLWDESAGKFEFSDDLYLNGDLEVNNIIATATGININGFVIYDAGSNVARIYSTYGANLEIGSSGGGHFTNGGALVTPQVTVDDFAFTTTKEALFYVYETNTTLITSSTAVKLFDPQTEEYDVGSDIASGTFTCPDNGYYHFDITCTIEDMQDDGGTYQLFAIAGGDTHIVYHDASQQGADGTGYHSLRLSFDKYLTASQTVVCYAKQSGGTFSASTIRNGFNTSFNGHRIR